MTGSVHGDSRPRVLVLLYPGCIAYEIQLAAELAHRTHDVEVATPGGRDVALGNGLVARADVALEAVDATRYVAALVPGGDPAELFESGGASPLIAALAERGALVAAVCAGPLLLAKAGVLVGRRFTHGYGDFHTEFLAPYWRGAEYVDAHVVEDGGLLTAQPQGTLALAVRFAERLGAIDAAEASYRLRYARGEVTMREAMDRARARGEL